MQGSCCLSPLVPWTQVWTLLGVCCRRRVTPCPGRGLRRRGLTTVPCGRLPSTSRSYCCAWRRRTRDWRVCIGHIKYDNHPRTNPSFNHMSDTYEEHNVCSLVATRLWSILWCLAPLFLCRHWCIYNLSCGCTCWNLLTLGLIVKIYLPIKIFIMGNFHSWPFSSPIIKVSHTVITTCLNTQKSCCSQLRLYERGQG